MRANPLTLLSGLLVLFALALANPLLDPKFWETATPQDVERAVKGGARVDARDENGLTPLHRAAAFNPNPEIIQALVRLGADINARTKYDLTPLHLAAYSNSNPQVVLVLLDLGADPKARTSDGKTAWDLIQENPKLKNTPAYWKLNDLRF